ncbi:hypothetical protein HDK77DRAFT_186459 [Phyllosticta capitalensis]|uniref:Biogenesis of lysosome-related organelles complex 1 subunit CNL1 n=1 Tax=Phyllosticta capitalensis TaxID=121624 RepID=A0ABR1YWA7_9PEZI
MASPAASIPDSQLGLSPGEIQTLRHHQQLALSQNGGSSSRAASQASSQGRLLLDPTSLQALSHHFDRLLHSIQQRWAALNEQTQSATAMQYDRAGRLIQDADAQIARFHEILRQIDELQTEFEKIRHIGQIVKQYRARVEQLDRRVGR